MPNARRPLPNRPLKLLDLLQFGVARNGGDMRRILVPGMMVGLLGLVVPLMAGVIIDRVIPQGDRNQLVTLGLLILVVVTASALYRGVQNLAVLRMQTRLGMELQAAIWDRVLNLPVSFFRDYSAGDLGNRIMGISKIQQILSGTIIGAILAGIFSLFSLALLFYYSTTLALVAAGLVAVSLLVTLWLSRVQVKYQRTMTALQGEISSIALQAFAGISKLRASGSESRVFANWGERFAEYKRTSFLARDAQNKLTVFSAGYQLVTLMTIFGVIAFSAGETLTTGQFIAFNAAFVQFFMAVMGLSQAAVAVMNVVPLYERVKPVLEAHPEVDEVRRHPGELTGKIELSHVSFRYDEDGPLIIDDVSMEINPGEFVALVGPSGSGKSTIMRLLLGFEQPEAGAIYYDGQNLSQVDVREMRRMIGVVLQNGSVMVGDIFTNIIGTRSFTIKDAWKASEMAGLKADIEAMPMGMHTIVNQGGTTLSGGQRQRLLIARAIVNRPRIIFFDEATSALDSKTQAIVSDSVESLQATRIVVAHRLGTIKDADRIYVMDEGRVVEQGTYEELMRANGLFSHLAERQLA